MPDSKRPRQKSGASANRSNLSSARLERESGSAAATEALALKGREAAKRKTRYERSPSGQRGARSREPHTVN